MVVQQKQMFVELLDGLMEKRDCFLLTASRVGMTLFIGPGSQANVLCFFSILADLQMTC